MNFNLSEQKKNLEQILTAGYKHKPNKFNSRIMKIMNETLSETIGRLVKKKYVNRLYLA